MNVLCLSDSPFRSRQWAVHKHLWPHEGTNRKIIVGNYSLQPLRVVKMLLRNEGISKAERSSIIDAAAQFPTSFDDLKDI
jgi:hypothetical protein